MIRRRNAWPQVFSAFAIGLGAGAALGVLFAPQSGEDTRAVSYTHLDVYKRQRRSWVRIPSAPPKNIGENRSLLPIPESSPCVQV